MDEIALHIDFLLHTHDCIIVPGLGGFVVNVTNVERNGLWGLSAPSFELIFNSKLTYNDGLLAKSLMKTNNVSYEIAIKQIETASKELREKLLKDEEVVWSNLGTFKTNKDNNLIFLANKAYVRPQFFGLTNVSLKPSALVLSANSEDENSIPVKSIMRYVSTAIAVAVLFFFVVVSYNNYNPQSQHAEMVSKPLIFIKSKPQTASPNTSRPLVAKNYSNETTAKALLPATVDNETVQSTSSSINYYIVVGVYEVRDVAEKTLSTLKRKGFSTASMIVRPGRLDVYSASFTNRKEAYTFLLQFKADNASYRDAWILKR